MKRQQEIHAITAAVSTASQAVATAVRLVVGISSRALFDLDESHQVFEDAGLQAYADYQAAHENDILAPGTAFAFVKKLLALTDPMTNERLVEVVLFSRNSADTGLRIFNSIQHYHLPISRAAFCNGRSPYPYIAAFKAHLFLSAHTEDVKTALRANCAAARLLTGKKQYTKQQDDIKIAFDGDAVLFSDEAESIFQKQGLAAFTESEQAAAKKPLQAGPFRDFLRGLHEIQSLFSPEHCPIRTALITARGAPAHERVIRTLRDWKIRVDEALFLGGMEKAAFLRAFGADIFFDDQMRHCERSCADTPTGHVPHGIMNTDSRDEKSD